VHGGRGKKPGIPWEKHPGAAPSSASKTCPVRRQKGENHPTQQVRERDQRRKQAPETPSPIPTRKKRKRNAPAKNRSHDIREGRRWPSVPSEKTPGRRGINRFHKSLPSMANHARSEEKNGGSERSRPRRAMQGKKTSIINISREPFQAF